MPFAPSSVLLFLASQRSPATRSPTCVVTSTKRTVLREAAELSPLRAAPGRVLSRLFLLLVRMLLVAMRGAPSSVLAPSSKARSP